MFFQTLNFQSKNASLQAQLEKQIDYTEQLEFELTKVRKQIEKDAATASQKIQDNVSTIEQLEGNYTQPQFLFIQLHAVVYTDVLSAETLQNLQAKLSAAQNQSSDTERSMRAKIEQLKETINNRDRILGETVQQHQSTLAEHETLSQLVQQQEM